MTIAIKVSSVGKSVISNEAELTILKDVSFEVQSGQSVAIVGTSGAGKSTLMTLLAGLDTPSTGDIELLGKSLSQMDDEARAQIRSESIGFVFQSFLLIPSLTALENVTLPAILRGEGEDIKKSKTVTRFCWTFRARNASAISTFRWRATTCGISSRLYDSTQNPVC